jgi:hypothetical protein
MPSPGEAVKVASVPEPAGPSLSVERVAAETLDQDDLPLPTAITMAAPTAAGRPDKPAVDVAVRNEQKPAATQLAMAVPSSEPPIPKPLKLGVYTEAFSYEGETGGSLRAKMQQALRKLLTGVLGEEVVIDHANAEFRQTMRQGAIEQLCKRTRMDRLLLADLTPVDLVSATESADWPEMRYAAVDCVSGRLSRSDWIRMEPVVGDVFPMQQSMLKTARRFVHEHRYMLEKQ